MPEQLAHRDLRNRSAEILRDVQNGAAYEITNHGEVVAILSPAHERNRADLRIRKATRREKFTALDRVQRDVPVQQSLDELRAER
ncbi:MAG: type II toxin-antitoxin system prevent-host-death family antitoxin [Nocardioidaceae bacterium]|jgi:prevent-host-death family protein|nr:type II toxin-antitoxin system prevent-host-death family antitoxin [Nocardioidaceae bacterium]MDQ3326101.1 type II toxin-antitoxin system prevent-host-death family antitoxin [Actinomycetota bacterium]